MNKKLLKFLLFVFVCFLFFDFSVAKAQSQLKIDSVNKGTFFGSGISVKGESLPGATISLSVNDINDTFSYSMRTVADETGKWRVSFDQLFKSDEYYIQVTQQDVSGLQTGSTKFGPVQIKGAFAFIVHIFSTLVIILLIGFVGGWYINKLAEIKRFRRILMSQRDIAASYSVLKKDVDAALKDLNSNKAEEWKVNEVEFLLKRINDNLEKMNKYVVKGINIIGKYDIITKIDNKLK